jgi:hypothetical protein
VREAVAVAEKTGCSPIKLKQSKTEAKYFEQQLSEHFQECLQGGVSTSAAREKVWGKYHKLRCSDGFRSFWKTLLTIIGCTTVDDPVFCQYITHHIIKNTLKEAFPTPSSSCCSAPTISHEESNVVRYVAGYVCNKLYKKQKRIVI